MRYQDFRIVESAGIFNRKPGQEFVDPSTKSRISFQESKIYPEDREQFDSVEERDDVIDNIKKQLTSEITWTNSPTNSALAFGLAILTEVETGQQVVFGRFFKKRNLMGIPATWQNNQLGNFKLQTNVAKKAVAGLMPQDIIGIEEKRYKGLEPIIRQIETNLKDKPEIVQGFKSLASGTMPVLFKGQAENHEAVRDYAGEVMQPIGLMSGVIKGDAEEARAELLDNSAWKECEVFWPAGKNYNLVDSVLVGPNGQEVGISSKGKKGADASVKNVYDAIQNAKKKNSDLISTYAKTVKIVDDFHTSDAKTGPLKVAVYLGILSSNAAKFINEMNKRNITVNELRNSNNKEILDIFKSHSAQFNHQNYNPYFHMLANVAKLVAKELNKDEEFGNGMLQFMNQASIVQIYTQSKVTDADVLITSFNAVYPPNFDGRIFLNGGKTYTATKIIGKMAFNYQPN
jgi:hypothetical protein